MGLATSLALVASASSHDLGIAGGLPLRIGTIVLVLALAAYVMDKERHLRGLAQTLVREREAAAAVAERLREMESLHAAGTAMNSVLVIEEVFRVILMSAVDVLRPIRGSILIADSPTTPTLVCAVGGASDTRTRITLGEGLAGRVAQQRIRDPARGPHPRRPPDASRERGVRSTDSPRPAPRARTHGRDRPCVHRRRPPVGLAVRRPRCRRDRELPPHRGHARTLRPAVHNPRALTPLVTAWAGERNARRSTDTLDRSAHTRVQGCTVKPGQPDNVVVVLLDSLNRHLLGAYGGDEFETPNLDRFAARHATRFTRHVTGSLPCMPARHDILCGTLDFLWRPWGSIELWDEPITAKLRAQNVTTMLVTDHPHLFETGGENYHTDFSGWDYLRGHEGDPWRTYLDPSWIGTPELRARPSDWFYARAAGADEGGWIRGYDRSRTFFREESDYPGPRTMQAAADWLSNATPHHDRWMLFVDEFDPHEPFDTPAPWRGRYEETPFDGDALIWPPYTNGGVSQGLLTETEAQHIRANYGSKLSMIDHWFGKILSALDERDLWDSTAVIVCTDHGHYLGEMRDGKDIWGKPAVPQYEPLGHTPLLIHWPGIPGGATCDALTTNVDLYATIADIYDVENAKRADGVSLAPLLRGEAASVREWALGGVWGAWVQITDGRRKYARAPVGDNFPLSMWSNRWSSMPMPVDWIKNLPPPDRRATLGYMPGSDIPVIRQPFAPGDMLPMWAATGRPDEHHVYDVSVDPDEQENRHGEAVEDELAELLRTALADVQAPEDQLARLGL